MIWTVLGTIGVIATMFAGLLADRRWGIVPRKERLSPPRPALPAHEAGEARCARCTSTRSIYVQRLVE